MAKTKRKTEILAVKYPNGAIICETAYDRNLLQGLPIGVAVKITPLGNNRNYQHHKKFFALLETGFEYWQPQFEVLSEAERWLANQLCRRFAEIAKNPTAYTAMKAVADQELERIKQHREERLDYEGMKTLEAYLNYVMKKAGFYDIKPSQDGGTFKERWSISFANMPQEKFNEVYKGVYGVIWNETLCNVYEEQWMLDNKINQLMGFH